MFHIRPITDLRNHTKELLDLCHEENQPVFLTRQGRGDCVIMSLAHYEQMKSSLQLYQLLGEAEAADLAASKELPMRK